MVPQIYRYCLPVYRNLSIIPVEGSSSSFEYDSEMIRNLCFSSYIQDDNSVKYPKNLSYKKFCQTVFEDRMYMKEILSNEEYRSYENYLQMAENGYLPE